MMAKRQQKKKVLSTAHGCVSSVSFPLHSIEGLIKSKVYLRLQNWCTLYNCKSYVCLICSMASQCCLSWETWPFDQTSCNESNQQLKVVKWKKRKEKYIIKKEICNNEENEIAIRLCNEMKSDRKLSSKSMFYYPAIQVNGNLFDCKSGNFILNL